MDQPQQVRPQAGAQEMFLSSPADIAIYGGAAGGGKSWALLLEPIRHLSNRNFGAVIFRRTFPQITREGGLWDEAGKLYPLAGGQPNRSDLYWSFPNGSRISFAHLQLERTKLDWQGAQVALIEFDELTHFTESQFFYMLSRNRSTSGVRPYIRATTNPDADSWVARFIDWWIGDDGYPIEERAGVLRWFVRLGDQLIWGDTREGLIAEQGADCQPKSVTFIPASIEDNPALLKADPSYRANLMALTYVDRMRLLKGNWKVRVEGGTLFNREWVDIVDTVPEGGTLCRYWDFAATAKQLAKDDPDFTAAVLMLHVDDRWYVVDSIAMQASPARVDRLFVALSKQDAERAAKQGRSYMVRWEIEPGSAGIREAHRMAAMLAGLDARGKQSRGDKITRGKPFCAQAEMGNVSLLRGRWNDRWLTHMHNQPGAPHDDTWDATAGSFQHLGQGRARQARSYQG